MGKEPRIKWNNFKVWMADQIKRKAWFRNSFITRNAWGVLINTVFDKNKKCALFTFASLEHYGRYRAR